MKRFVGILLTGMALTLGISFVAPSAAFAHDEIVATSPASDTEVAPGILKVSITFNEDVVNIPPHQGLGIQVQTPSGELQNLDCLDINGAELASVFNATETGPYQVSWRSVSTDGHANSGLFTFKVAEGAAAGEAPAANSSCAAAVAASETVDAQPTELDLTKAGMASASAAAVAASEKAAQKANDKSSGGLDPLAGLGIGIGLFVVLSVLGALAAEAKKRGRARKEAQKKLKAEVEANPDLLRGL